MKKNYLLLLAFVLLGSATAWYLLTKNKGETTTLGWDRKFKVEKPDEIQKIFIAKRTGETTTLERTGDHWTVNGQHKASPNAVENLLRAITNVELKYVPPRASTDNIVTEMGARGIKVEIYNKKNEKMKVYYVGGVTADARGTHFIMEGSEQPMIVEVPQMEGQIRTRYDLTGDDWRDRSIFDFRPEEIQAVSIEYPTQRNKSFHLERKGKGFEVRPFYDNVPPLNREVDESSTEAFLSMFKNVMAEAFENGYAKKDSVRQSIPFSIVSVTDVKGQERKAAFYPTYILDAATGERQTPIVERYFADVNTGDWMLAQHRVFEKIFWAYEALLLPEPRKVKN